MRRDAVATDRKKIVSVTLKTTVADAVAVAVAVVPATNETDSLQKSGNARLLSRSTSHDVQVNQWELADRQKAQSCLRGRTEQAAEAAQSTFRANHAASYWMMPVAGTSKSRTKMKTKKVKRSDPGIVPQNRKSDDVRRVNSCVSTLTTMTSSMTSSSLVVQIQQVEVEQAQTSYY
jgi:hypothetical protein